MSYLQDIDSFDIMYKLYQGIQWSWGWVENKSTKVDGIADVQL